MTDSGADPPSITLHVGTSTWPNGEMCETYIGTWQTVLFRELGVICPPVRVHATDEMREAGYRVQIGDQLYEFVSLASADEAAWPSIVAQALADAVREHAADFVDGELVTHYLVALEPLYPALVAACKERISVVQTVDRLHLEMKSSASSSIRNLPGILEELLVNAVTESRKELAAPVP